MLNMLLGVTPVFHRRTPSQTFRADIFKNTPSSPTYVLHAGLAKIRYIWSRPADLEGNLIRIRTRALELIIIYRQVAYADNGSQVNK